MTESNRRLRIGSEDRVWIRAEPTLRLEDVGPDASAEARTLCELELWAARTSVSQWRDSAGVQTKLQVPLVDLAAWVAENWVHLAFEEVVPSPVLRIGRRSFVMAERVLLAEEMHLGPAAQDALYDWRERHCLEFAATDYALPNLCIRRVDNAVEVSWSPREVSPPQADIVFTAWSGAVVVPVDEWTSMARELLSWTLERCEGVGKDDARVAAIRARLAEKPTKIADEAMVRWYPDWDQVRHVVPKAELETLGRSGEEGVITSFLRSSGGRVSPDELLEIVADFKTQSRVMKRDAVNRLAEGLDDGIEVVRPWESGIRLAKLVRRRLAEVYGRPRNEPLDIVGVFRDLGIPVGDVSLFSTQVEGISLVDASGRVFAAINRRGRLSRSGVGRRSTLAHELCHIMFDAAHGQALGQVELRGFQASNREKRANAFAAEFLLPRAVLAAHATGPRIAETALRYLARDYGVGMWLARHQAENQGFSVS